MNDARSEPGGDVMSDNDPLRSEVTDIFLGRRSAKVVKPETGGLDGLNKSSSLFESSRRFRASWRKSSISLSNR